MENAMQTGCAQVAQDLLSSLDELISALGDSPPLQAALCRERERLVNHLLVRLERELAAPRPPRLRRRRLGAVRSRSRQLRRDCYLAIADGILSSRRFDTLMLLANRAQRSTNESAYASSSSGSSAPPSDGGATGAFEGGASSNCPGDSEAGGRYSSRDPWPSCTKRMIASTMRPCA